jgi:hypothetical protein
LSAIDNQPTNLNFLSSVNFKFQIKKAPNINFFIQQVNIPGIAMSGPKAPNPFTDIPWPSDKIDFERLSVTFKVNEDMSDYLEIYNWIRMLGFPETYDEYATIEATPKYLGTGIKSDISILVLDSNDVPKLEYTIKDAFPIQLNGFVLSSTNPDVGYVTCTAIFSYTNFVLNALV